jgi:hypothetical protein
MSVATNKDSGFEANGRRKAGQILIRQIVQRVANDGV